jgi:polysaccharide chain length determinant protein (PEP-CTERM system associated)
MEHEELHPLDYLSVVQRRKWWLIVPAALSVVVGLALVRYLPKEYKSSTTIGVTSPTVSPNILGSAIPFDNQERLRAISQQLLSLPILARVVKEEQLTSDDAIEAGVSRLRKGIQITVPEPVAAMNEPRHLDLFVVGYNDKEPALAQRVANRLATVFVDENARTRTVQAADASAFVGSQLAASQTRLAALDARLRAAKEAHIGQLPEQMGSNLQRLASLRQQIDSNATLLRNEQDRLSMVDLQIDAMSNGRADAVAAVAGADGLPTGETRILTLEKELATARTMYTSKHPDVLALEESLAEARKDAAQERNRPPADRLAQLQLNPAYRKLVADRDAIRLRIRDLQRESSDAQRQVTVFQARMEAAPMVEQQLTSLQRDYDLERQQYSDLSSKQHQAEIAETVARNRTGEQFAILYPANFPSEPTKPVPLRVMLITILLGCGLGIGLMLGAEYFDDSIHEARELTDEFDLPVIGTIPRLPA